MDVSSCTLLSLYSRCCCPFWQGYDCCHDIRCTDRSSIRPDTATRWLSLGHGNSLSRLARGQHKGYCDIELRRAYSTIPPSNDCLGDLLVRVTCPWLCALICSIKGTARYIATSLSKIYVVFTVPHAKSLSITVATLDAVTGNIIDTHALDASLAAETDLRVVGSHSSAPLAIWNEKGKIKANILGSKSIIPLSTEVPSPPLSY